MKVARFVLKVTTICLAIAAAACCIVAYWDQIAEFFGMLKAKVSDRACCCHHESDDYADWDE
ncbi:MAG: hypothetical protein RR450_02095 [Oscillospiraceae bacterium]